MKRKGTINRLLSAILVVMLVTTTVAYTTFKTPEKVKAVAIADDALFIMMILGALGISYIGAQVESQPPVDVGDFLGSIDDQLSGLGVKFDEETKAYYDEYKGGEWYPEDFDPDNDDPNDKVPKWEQLKEWCKKHGNKLKVTAGGALATVLGKTGYDMYKQTLKGNLMPENTEYPINVPDSILHDKSLQYVVSIRGYTGKHQGNTYDYISSNPIGLSVSKYYNKISVSYHGDVWTNEHNRDWEKKTTNSATGPSLFMDDYKLNYTNCPIFDNGTDAVNFALGKISQDYKPTKDGLINTDTLPFSTDARDHIKNNPNADTLPVAENSRFPTEDEINKFLEGIRNPDFPGDTQPVVDDFINTITKPPIVDPDEPVNPTPPVTPTVTPNPDITETPTPDTDITDEAKKKFLLPESIKKKFPFCIPFDLIDSFTVLKSSGRKAPKIDLPLKSERYGIDYTMSIDLAVYDKQAELLRTLELLMFIVSLIIATRSLIRG